jgi:polyisoprenoid-binding protein YceI
MRRLIALPMMLVAVMTGAAAAPPARSALLGDWQFDAAKSSFSGAIPYRSARISFTQVRSRIRVVEDIVEGTAVTLHFGYVDTHDGRSVVVTGNPFYDTESTRWIDRSTAVRTERRAGKIIGTTTMKVADDGASYAATASRTLPSGRLYTSVIVWNRLSR